MNRKVGGVILSCLAVAGLFAWLLSQMPLRKEKVAVELEGYQAWPQEVVEAAKSVPLQDGARVKPLATFGRFHLLMLSGGTKTYWRDAEGDLQVLGSTEWILDCIFRPRFAAQMRVFLIEDDVVLQELGVPEEERRKKRDVYSYRELVPYKDKLLEKTLVADQARRDMLEPTEVQKKLVTLRDKVVAFETVAGTFAYGAQSVAVEPELAAQLNSGERIGFVDFLQFSYLFVGLSEQAESEGRPLAPQVVEKAQFARLFERTAKLGVKWLAPLKNPMGEWATYGHLIQSLNEAEGRDESGQLNEIGQRNFSEVAEGAKLFVQAQQDMKGFKSSFLDWASDRVEEGKQIPAAEHVDSELEQKLAESSGDDELLASMIGAAGVPTAQDKIASEVRYYQRHYLHNGLGWFLLGFLAVALGWLAPAGKFGVVCRWGATLSVLVATCYICWAVVHRSLIMNRPPVGNLFDTIPFIVGTAGLVVLFAEAITRRGLAIAVGSVFGVFGVFLAIRYEAGTAEDTMTPLIAVLRSNYWLSTHVITITLGYMGALLAAAISHVYLIGRLTGLDEGDKRLRRSLTRMTYGVVGFALVFSTIGTILGGVWANDSWGRFWGWDPKENGALMIVLMNLIILHARIGGLVKEFGIHILSVLGAVVVAFSWWGVNMLGEGLHSYGFTDGASTLNLFYAFELTFILVCLLIFWVLKDLKKNRLEAKVDSRPDEPTGSGKAELAKR